MYHTLCLAPSTHDLVITTAMQVTRILNGHSTKWTQHRQGQTATPSCLVKLGQKQACGWNHRLQITASWIPWPCWLLGQASDLLQVWQCRCCQSTPLSICLTCCCRSHGVGAEVEHGSCYIKNALSEPLLSKLSPPAHRAPCL